MVATSGASLELLAGGRLLHRNWYTVFVLSPSPLLQFRSSPSFFVSILPVDYSHIPHIYIFLLLSVVPTTH
jgi:hypothetical protein